MGNGGALAQEENDPVVVAEAEPEPEPDITPGEEPEPDTDDAPQPVPESEPAEPAEPAGEPESQALYEERLKKSQSAFKSYTTRVGTILEEDGQYLLECPLCPPMHKGFVDARDAGRIPDELVAVVMEFVGLARKQQYEPDPETAECPACKGYGKVQTGSKVPGNEDRKCAKCHGYGYFPPPTPSSNGTVAADDFHAPIGESAEPYAQGERDSWGEPRILPDGRENPNYGKMPQHKVTIPPYGVTANLTVQDAA